MTKGEKAHLDRVASLPCILCGDRPVEVHHIREGQGGAQRGGHFLTTSLCVPCHRGPQGVHGDKTMLRIMKTNEMEMLDETLRKLYG